MVRTTNDANICLSIASVLMSLGTQSALCFVLLFSIIRYMYMGGERFSLVRQWQRRRQKLTETHTCQTRIILSNRTAVISTNIERMWRKKRGHKAFQPLIDTHKWIYVFCRNSENFIRSPVRWVLSLIFLSLSLSRKQKPQYSDKRHTPPTQLWHNKQFTVVVVVAKIARRALEMGNSLFEKGMLEAYHVTIHNNIAWTRLTSKNNRRAREEESEREKTRTQFNKTVPIELELKI